MFGWWDESAGLDTHAPAMPQSMMTRDPVGGGARCGSIIWRILGRVSWRSMIFVVVVEFCASCTCVIWTGHGAR